MTFTSIDYDKFCALRVAHVATRLEELIQDEANDTLTPERLFLTAVDDALEGRRVNKVDKLIRQAQFPIPALSGTSAGTSPKPALACFSSTHNTTAASGGFRYSPMTSYTFSTNCGSLESLNPS